MNEERETTLFDSIEFIVRHPWLIVSPFIIIMSVVFAQLSTMALMYKSTAIVTFEASEMKAADSKAKIDELLQKMPKGYDTDEKNRDLAFPSFTISEMSSRISRISRFSTLTCSIITTRTP